MTPDPIANLIAAAKALSTEAHAFRGNGNLYHLCKEFDIALAAIPAPPRQPSTRDDMSEIVTQDGEETPVNPLPTDPQTIIKAFAKVCKVLGRLSPEQRARALRSLIYLYEDEKKP